MARSTHQTQGKRVRLGMMALGVLAVVLFFALRSVLETPSGEGVPGPEDWAQQTQSSP